MDDQKELADIINQLKTANKTDLISTVKIIQANTCKTQINDLFNDNSAEVILNEIIKKEYNNIKNKETRISTKKLIQYNYVMDNYLNDITKYFVMSIDNIFEFAFKGVHFYKDKKEIGKIINYFHTANNAKNIFEDKKVYNYLRRECITAYNNIKYPEVKEFIVKQTNKDFLKIK